MCDNRERHGLGHSQNNLAGRAPNVKPKLDERGRSSDEQQRKTKKPARVRRSRSNESHGVERGRRREKDRHSGGWRRRGRSEEARRRENRESDRRKELRRSENDIDVTECAICFCSYDNTFKTPKLLVCGHTFCLECLARINVTSAELKALSCPVCRELTEIPHGQDLPRLSNNEDIIGQLPPDMRRALSIRFKRSQGKLLLKNPGTVILTKSRAPKSQEGQVEDCDLSQRIPRQTVVQATIVDVGRPPNRVRGHLRRLFRSDQCYYAVVVSIISVTVALVLVGILAFVIVPNVILQQQPVPSGNQSTPISSEEAP